MHLQLWQWAALLLGAATIGMAKTGIPGVGIFAVALFATVIPVRESTGVVLPLLIVGDCFAVGSYYRHAVWSHLWRLFPWAVTGILIGYLALGKLDNNEVAKLMGVILLIMVAMHLWRRYYMKTDQVPNRIWFAACMGLLAGFTTMVANAAGPIMVLYLLAMCLPKMEFMGTAAIYAFLLNWFKVPLSQHLGLINVHSLRLDLFIAPAIVVGALGGRKLLPVINQDFFEWLALALTVVAALKLLIF